MQPGSHLTIEERIDIEKYYRDGLSYRNIGKKLGRHYTTISRELKRNGNKTSGYNHWDAFGKYVVRRKRCVKPCRLAHDEPLRNLVVEGLAKRWSPEEIVGRYKWENPGFQWSHTTIYRAIGKGLFPDCTRKKSLRRRGKRRRKATTNTATIKPNQTIHDRPAIAAQRIEIGHSEGDTVLSPPGKGGAVTIVDMMSRYLIAGLIANKTMQHTRDVMVAMLKEHKMLTITLDNGSEFAAHEQIEILLNTKIYFCDPHSPWQRGLNENTNGLLRDYYPKGFDFTSITEEEFQRVVDEINDRPRKCLGWRTPREVYFMASGAFE